MWCKLSRDRVSDSGYIRAERDGARVLKLSSGVLPVVIAIRIVVAEKSLYNL